jgi:hypothetical protein
MTSNMGGFSSVPSVRGGARQHQASQPGVQSLPSRADPGAEDHLDCRARRGRVVPRNGLGYQNGRPQRHATVWGAAGSRKKRGMFSIPSTENKGEDYAGWEMQFVDVLVRN